MTTDHRTAPTRLRWSDLPAAFNGAVVIGALGWFISFTDTGLATDNGQVTRCWSYDYAMVVLGVGSVLLAALGVVRWLRSARRVPTALIVLLTLAVVVNGALLVLRGTDTFPDVCGPLLDGTAQLPASFMD